MMAGKATIRKKEVIDRAKVNAPQLLKKYTQTQILLKVRTEKRAFDRRNDK